MKQNIYYVYHETKVGKNTFSGKEIGYFSTLKRAKEIVREYKKLEGFKKYPKDFRIKKVKINKKEKKLKLKYYI